MCCLFCGGSFVDNIYKGYVICFCIHSAMFFLLVGAFNPFTFKVIIAKYGPVAISFTVLGLGLYTFLYFLSREYPLAFVGELVWWC